MSLDARKKERIYNIIAAAMLLFLLAERIYIFRELGSWYQDIADSCYYFPSGYFFAETGVISYQLFPYRTAMIMPAMPVILGGLSFIFGQGTTLWVVCRVLWCVLGVITAWYVYKTANLFAPKWCGLFAMLFFFLPNMAWMNHVVQTETPYMLLLTMCIYFTFQMGNSGERKYFIYYILSFMAALMFRANIMVLLPFTAVYILLARKDLIRREFIYRTLIMAAAILVFVIPWTIRNYIAFDAFVPVTYGAGDPTLLGTYEGEGYPEDEKLDYDANVDSAFYEKYARYYDENGQLINPECEQYLQHMYRQMKAEYRMRVWFDNDPAAFLKSYLFIKPSCMLNWVWAWECVMGVSYETLTLFSWLHFALCGVAVLLSLLLKKLRLPVLLLAALYWVNIYIVSMAFASDRYAGTLVGIRFTLAGLAVYLLTEAYKAFKNSRKPKTAS